MKGKDKMEKLHKDAQTIINKSIEANMPQAAVKNALKNHQFSANIFVVAIGKAAWAMANAAYQELGSKIKKGIVITKYGHSQGAIGSMEIIEAGHPISDENTIKGAQKAIDLVSPLTQNDEVLFLISGGGSALFEKPLEGLTLNDIIDINNQLLSSGADIVEINMIRKRLSAVKAGRFAQICAPSKVFTVVLSDVLGDRLDSIASGPAAPDMSTMQDALDAVKKYNLKFNETIQKYLISETPKKLDNVETVITGSVRALCESAGYIAQSLGYTPYILCSEMKGEAREIGAFTAAIAKQAGGKYSPQKPCAIILGGETIVHIKGKGKGGRNQEIALSAAMDIAGMDNVLIFSVGSDGTDGPTDAAGAIVDGTTKAKLSAKEIKIQDVLDNNDSYNALKAVDSLIITGPTGTNVNDITVILAK
jgi:hydroxypyruvate reductase